MSGRRVKRLGETNSSLLQQLAKSFATGVYTGNDADNRQITGLGFDPRVMFYTASGIVTFYYKDDQMGTWRSTTAYTQVSEDNTLKFITDGFEVDNTNPGNRPNEAARIYTWSAWG